MHGLPSAACGKFDISWALNAGTASYVVQKICIDANVVFCTRKNGCCKGERRETPCSICFFEVLVDTLNPDEEHGEAIDDWGMSSFANQSTDCGNRGSFVFTSEIRSFGLGVPVKLGETRGSKKFYKCGKHPVQGSSRSQSEQPDWRDMHSNSITRFA